VDQHQARLDSIVSCRCHEESRAQARAPEDDRRSSDSYGVPQNASPIPVPPPEDQDRTLVAPMAVEEVIPSPDTVDSGASSHSTNITVPSLRPLGTWEEYLEEDARLRREAAQPGTPVTQVSESFFNSPAAPGVRLLLPSIVPTMLNEDWALQVSRELGDAATVWERIRPVEIDVPGTPEARIEDAMDVVIREGEDEILQLLRDEVRSSL
jgi:hypothetical protein